MEIALKESKQCFFGVTMTDFIPRDRIGSVMCCQDGDTFIAINLNGLDKPIPSGFPFYAVGERPDDTRCNWNVDLNREGHRWLTFDKKYLDKNYKLNIDKAVDANLSDGKPTDSETIPSALSYKKLRKNMIGFRIISTELKREDLGKFHLIGAPKYISGKAYHYYFRQQMVSFKLHSNLHNNISLENS